MTTTKNQQKKYDIRERVFDFSQRVLEISEMIPKTKVCDILQTQFVKSGTAIGANLEESDGAITKRDFVNKMVIARKEAKETRYWLRLIKSKYLQKAKVEDDIEELSEIIKIISAIINKTRNKDPSL